MEMNTRRPLTELTEAYGEEAVAVELELEARMVSLGAASVRKSIEKARERGNESATRYGQALLAVSVDTVAGGVRAFLEKAAGNGAGRRHLAVKYLKQVDPEVASFIAMKAVIDSLTGKRQLLQRVAVKIGSQIEDEARFAAFEEADKKRFKKAQEKASKGTTYHRKKSTMAGHDRRYGAGDEWTGWPEADRLHVGMKMLDFVLATELVTIGSQISTRRDTVKVIEPTKKLMEWIEREASKSELLSPTQLPMVVRPLQWTSPFDGGYLTVDAQVRNKLVKSNNQAYLAELSERAHEMADVYLAVNTLQDTRWAINSRVHEVATAIWEDDVEGTPLPSREDIGFCPCPRCGAALELPKLNTRGGEAHACFEDEEDGEVTLRAWKQAAHEQHSANVSLRSKRMAAAKTLRVAEQFNGTEAIYFPYQLDFRGRIYAMSAFNPQGTDLTKGLLHFADGMAIEDGVAAGWLAIQGANTYGYDKASLEDRIGWVEEHEEIIVACAGDPLGNTFWMSADKPWQFLAFCFEWAGFCEQGYGFVSHLPVALDGSCSGIQHFSAMLRDKEGGDAVNLVPRETPSDIYQKVCDKVLHKLKLDAGEIGSTIALANAGKCKGGRGQSDREAFADYSQAIAKGRPDDDLVVENESNSRAIAEANDDEEVFEGLSLKALAMGWLSLEPTRKTTKRQVMTLPYGATLFSCREYTELWMRERVKEGYPMPWDKADQFKATKYMSQLIWESIGEVVVAAREAMDWLQSCARAVAKEELPVYWTTPCGFPVMQSYKSYSSRRVKTKLGEAVVKLSLQQEEDAIDKRRMANAISPNFVHSLDATHLVMSTANAQRKGIAHFAMIHDSFGTHAANSNELAASLREAFVDLYMNNDVLEDFRAQIMRQVAEEHRDAVRPVPAKGTLDVRSVGESDFFFA